MGRSHSSANQSRLEFWRLSQRSKNSRIGFCSDLEQFTDGSRAQRLLLRLNIGFIFSPVYQTHWWSWEGKLTLFHGDKGLSLVSFSDFFVHEVAAATKSITCVTLRISPGLNMADKCHYNTEFLLNISFTPPFRNYFWNDTQNNNFSLWVTKTTTYIWGNVTVRAGLNHNVAAT